MSSYLKFTDDAVIVFVVFRRLGLSTTKWKGCNEVVEAFEFWNLLQFPVINLEIECTLQIINRIFSNDVMSAILVALLVHF